MTGMGMLKHLCVGVVGLLLMPCALATYTRTPLAGLVGGADLIVVATIRVMESTTFTAEVGEVLVGDPRADEIKVHKFRDWTCARRWAKYAKGQQLLLFLMEKRWHGPADGVWYIMGAGDEGEMPVVGAFVYPGVPVTTVADRAWPGESHEVYGGIRSHRCSLGNMMTAIRDMQTCFEFTRGGRRFRPSGVRQKCADTELADLRQRSEVHEFLVASLRHTAADLKRLWRMHFLTATNFALPSAHELSFECALELAEGFGPNDPRLAETLRAYATYLRSNGRAAEAEACDARARKIQPDE